MSKAQNKNSRSNEIVSNRKAHHDYRIEERLEAGLVLEGWEAKSLRAGRVQLNESYAFVKRGEAWLLGMHVTPLSSASTHIHADPTRTRKLLLHAEELKKLIGKLDLKGYTLVPLSLYWKKGRVKCELGLAQGKKQHDKRRTIKERDWQRQKQRILKKG